MREPLCVVLVALGVAGAAAAQAPDDAALARTDLFAPDPEPTVRERSRPEYAAQAVPVGGVLLTPILGAEAGYDDNIYATRAATVGDAIFRVQPSLAVTSDWARDQVQAFAPGQRERLCSPSFRIDPGLERRRQRAAGRAA